MKQKKGLKVEVEIIDKEYKTGIISSTIKSHDKTVISSEDGAVVLIEQNYEGTIETFRLLKDKKSLKALIQGHNDRESNRNPGKPANEVFDGL